jgi:hypothetical protein
MSCPQSEQTPTESQVGAIISPPFVGELWTDPNGLSPKKGVPEDRNPREQPFYLLTYLSTYLVKSALFVVDIHHN